MTVSGIEFLPWLAEIVRKLLCGIGMAIEAVAIIGTGGFAGRYLLGLPLNWDVPGIVLDVWLVGMAFYVAGWVCRFLIPRL